MSESIEALRRFRLRARLVRAGAAGAAAAGSAGGEGRSARAGDEALHLAPDVPGCAYGAVTRRAVEDVTRSVERIEAKLNTLLLGALVSLLLEIWRSAHR